MYAQDPSLASKSRFLGRWPFNAYKFIMALYAVFWCVYWPVVERINDGFKLVTHWTFYVSAICELLRGIRELENRTEPIPPLTVTTDRSIQITLYRLELLRNLRVAILYLCDCRINYPSKYLT